MLLNKDNMIFYCHMDSMWSPSWGSFVYTLYYILTGGKYIVYSRTDVTIISIYEVKI